MSERLAITHQHYYPPLGEWVETRAYPSPDGGLAMFVGYITERKRAEQELRKTQEELAHVARVTTLGELTASIAHEVNQPLGAIVTNAQASLRLLSGANPDLTGAREAIEAMIGDSLRASEVINRFRALLKKSVPEKIEFNINEAIREVVTLTSSELSHSEVQVQTDLAHDLAPILGDRVQLQQVVLNLILNSKEAMSQAGWQQRDLLIRSEKNGPEEVLVTVRDSGVGVDVEKQDSVFDPFFTSKEGGLGLGLSISRTIIEAHGGKLWTRRNDGAPGATFQFTLPTKEAFAGKTHFAVTGSIR
jgi:C4-dicarboxylate-specific signal transduction histidine kinase